MPSLAGKLVRTTPDLCGCSRALRNLVTVEHVEELGMNTFHHVAASSGTTLLSIPVSEGAAAKRV